MQGERRALCRPSLDGDRSIPSRRCSRLVVFPFLLKPRRAGRSTGRASTPCVDHEAMHSSIGACHNLGSCNQLISAATVIQAIRCACKPIQQRLVRSCADYTLFEAAEYPLR
jgi:hypothetical protein